MDTPTDKSEKKPWIPAEHPWRWRLITGALMFVFAFLGVVFTMVSRDRSWDYWRFVSVLYAGLSLGLSLYLRHLKLKDSLATIWHEIFHWIGLMFAMGLLSNMVHVGLINSFAASLQALILLSLATFLAGVYIETTFLFIGGLLGCFALILSYLTLYSYLLFIPLTTAFLFGFYWFIRHRSHQSSRKEPK